MYPNLAGPYLGMGWPDTCQRFRRCEYLLWDSICVDAFSLRSCNKQRPEIICDVPTNFEFEKTEQKCRRKVIRCLETYSKIRLISSPLTLEALELRKSNRYLSVCPQCLHNQLSKSFSKIENTTKMPFKFPAVANKMRTLSAVFSNLAHRLVLAGLGPAAQRPART